MDVFSVGSLPSCILYFWHNFPLPPSIVQKYSPSWSLSSFCLSFFFIFHRTVSARWWSIHQGEEKSSRKLRVESRTIGARRKENSECLKHGGAERRLVFREVEEQRGVSQSWRRENFPKAIVNKKNSIDWTLECKEDHVRNSWLNLYRTWRIWFMKANIVQWRGAAN